MYKLWRANVIISVLQVIIGICLFVELKSWAEVSFTLALGSGTILALGLISDAEIAMMLLPATTVAAFLFFTLISDGKVGMALTGMLVVTFTYFAAGVSAHPFRESEFRLFLVTLPGIGILIGAPILCWRWYVRRTSATA